MIILCLATANYIFRELLLLCRDLQCSIRQGVNPKLTDPPESDERWYHPLRARKTSRRLELFLLILASIIATNCLIIFSSPESLSLTIDLTALITSGAAFFLSATTTLWAQVRKYAGGRHAWLCAGLSMWFAAEAIWVFYRQGLGVEIPYPSIADGAWIAGYGFLALYVYGIIGVVAKIRTIDRNLVLLVSLAVSLLLAYILNLTFGVAQMLSATEDIISVIVSLAYPILDGILLVPSMVIVWTLRKDDPSSSHWLMMSAALVLVSIGDIGFGYSFALAPTVAEKYEWIWALFYNTGYISIAASIVWYCLSNNFFSKNFGQGNDKLLKSR